MLLKQSNPTVVVLSGPTASGKSRVSTQIAAALSGGMSIINADSIQLYKELPILTAAPTPQDKINFSHQLYGVFPYTFKDLSVALWQQMAIQAIEHAFEQQHLPLIVGGTGFYLKTLLEGISPLPEIPQETRNTFENTVQGISTAQLHQQLQHQDPKWASHISPQDRQRILRGLLVFHVTQKPLSFWQKQPKKPLPYRFITVYLSIDRPQLKIQIAHRLQGMLSKGVVQEVKQFLQQPEALSSDLAKAIGVVELNAHLNSEVDFKTTLDKIQIRTQQYAKRQQTWFRTQIKHDHVFTHETQKEIPRFLKLL